MKTVVVGANGSEEAGRALQWSASFASLSHGRVVAVLAVSRLTVWMLAAVQVNPDPIVHQYEELLEGPCTAPLREEDVEYTTRLERGGAAGVLLRVADDEDADLIVIGAHRHNADHGKVTRRLLRRTTRPLVVIPRHE